MRALTFLAAIALVACDVPVPPEQDVVDATTSADPVPFHGRVGSPTPPIPICPDGGGYYFQGGPGQPVICVTSTLPEAGVQTPPLPDGGTGAIWYENDAGTVSALPACTAGQSIEWINGLPSCYTPAMLALPDGGSGAIWYQDGGGIGTLNCAAGQTIVWSGGVPICAVYVDGGGLQATLPDGGIGSIWYLSDAGVKAIDCAVSQTIVWANGIPVCTNYVDGGGLQATLPDGGVGAIWWQNDAGGISTLNCPSSQTVVWVSGAPTCEPWLDAGGSGSGALASYGADLSTTSTATKQYVNSISFSDAGAGGVVDVNGTGTILDWTAAPVELEYEGALVCKLSSASTDYVSFGASPATAGFVRVPTGAQTIVAAGTGNQNVLTLDTSADTVLNSGSGGAVILNNNGSLGLQVNSTAVEVAPNTIEFTGTAGSLASLVFQNAGASNGASMTHAAQNAVASGSSNGGNLNLESGSRNGGSGSDGTIVFGYGGTTNFVELTGATTTAGEGSEYWSSAITPTLGQLNPPSDLATHNFSIVSQAPYSGAGTNLTPGNIVLQMPSPIGTIAQPGLVQIMNGSSTFVQLGQLSNGSTSGAVWLNPAEAALMGTSTTTTLNAVNTLYFDIGDSAYALLNANEFEILPTGSTYVWNGTVGSITGQYDTVSRTIYNIQTSATSTATAGTVSLATGSSYSIHTLNLAKLAASPYTVSAEECTGAFSDSSGTVTQSGTTYLPYSAPTGGPMVTCNFGTTTNGVYLTLTPNSTATIEVEVVTDVTRN